MDVDYRKHWLYSFHSSEFFSKNIVTMSPISVFVEFCNHDDLSLDHFHHPKETQVSDSSLSSGMLYQ